jgi:hypothetical protein
MGRMEVRSFLNVEKQEEEKICEKVAQEKPVNR